MMARVSSWSIAILIAMGRVVTRCAASSTAKAAGVPCSSRSPAPLRLRQEIGMSAITQARKALVARILEGDGRASRGQRRAAFDNAGLAEPLTTLIGKVARHACQVTDADIAAARGWGLSEDQTFEIVVCAAIGQATRQYEGALVALEAARSKS